MEKIQTIFERDFTKGGKITTKQVVDLTDCIATEKLDGTNVRLTIRNHILVRLEKRRNPDKAQKHKGIIEPWYVDADQYSTEDKYIWEAVTNTDLSNIDDGEWSGEALGPKIQGNPLNLGKHTVFLFSAIQVLGDIYYENVPTTHNELKTWLPAQDSKFSPGNKIEGIVWWRNGQPVGKIKTKDFY